MVAPVRERVLLVDDDPDFRRTVQKGLEREKLEVLPAADGEAAVRLLQRNGVDCVLLDIMMPRVDGYDVCQQIRQRTRVPIIMVTAKDSVLDKIRGLEWGADDYITKPFNMLELVTRIRSAIRRSRWERERGEEVLQVGELEMDLGGHVVRRKGTTIPLTVKEFALLRALMEVPGKCLTREELLRKVWGSDSFSEKRVVDVCVRRLRKKLEEGQESGTILTVWGVGYKLQLEEREVS